MSSLSKGFYFFSSLVNRKKRKKTNQRYDFQGLTKIKVKKIIQ